MTRTVVAFSRRGFASIFSILGGLADPNVFPIFRCFGAAVACSVFRSLGDTVSISRASKDSATSAVLVEDTVLRVIFKILLQLTLSGMPQQRVLGSRAICRAPGSSPIGREVATSLMCGPGPPTPPGSRATRKQRRAHESASRRNCDPPLNDSK